MIKLSFIILTLLVLTGCMLHPDYNKYRIKVKTVDGIFYYDPCVLEPGITYDTDSMHNLVYKDNKSIVCRPVKPRLLERIFK